MKWMWSTAVVAVGISAAVNAQSGKEMGKSTMGDKMNATYTGCVEAVNHGEWFLLTHVGDDQRRMDQDGVMKNDATMKKKYEADASSDMHADHMLPGALVLAGRSDLRKHVGQKVKVTGSLSHGITDTTPNDRATLTIAVLKVLAKSCS